MACNGINGGGWLAAAKAAAKRRRKKLGTYPAHRLGVALARLANGVIGGWRRSLFISSSSGGG